MALADVARAHYAAQASLSDRTERAARALWSELDPADLAGSWLASQIGLRLFVALSTAQLTGAAMAVAYVAAALLQQNARSAPVGTVQPRALAGVASDGRDLETLLYEPLIRTKVAIRDGATVDRALDIGESSLATIVSTQVADAGRAAESVAMVAQPAATGWVRMLVPPSCSRCAILAGRVYRWSNGFLRHEKCDCRMVPSTEDVADDLRTDPQEYFNSLSPEDQDKYFTKAGAESIRLGADIAQVVNARRGARGLSQPGRLTDAEQKTLRGGRKRGRLERVDVYGRQVTVTTEGTTRRGVAGKRLIEAGGATDLRTAEERRADRARGDTARRPGRAKTPRLMPEAIVELADGDRDEAVRLLQRFGYLTPESARRAAQPARRAPTPPADLNDDQLDAEMQDAITRDDWTRFEALSAEAEQRDQRRQEEAAVAARQDRARERRAARAAAEEEQRAVRYEALLGEGVGDEEAVERAYGITVEQQRRGGAILLLRDQGYRGANFEALARASYKDNLESDYWAAEAATNGYLLNRRGESAGIDPRDLWLRNESYARKWASEELLAWWDVHGRVTFEEWKAQLLGDVVAAGRLRSERGDFLA